MSEIHQRWDKLLTPLQARLARVSLGYSVTELEQACGLHHNTIFRLERGKASSQSLRTLRAYFEERGIEFIQDENGKSGIIYPE
ncbi:MAG: helix-turn-helix domain-containing protein [Paracoccaceae bacterium]|nr:helix-turn-helix domain-containing protein [Paracoccaceae bacterium]MDE3238900.1 helix-turn-helix domain-containing protein [Paracoccaceae bacterium]